MFTTGCCTPWVQGTTTRMHANRLELQTTKKFMLVLYLDVYVLRDANHCVSGVSLLSLRLAPTMLCILSSTMTAALTKSP